MRRRGRQKGTLRLEGNWWVGFWWEWTVKPGEKGRWRKQRSVICAAEHQDGKEVTRAEAQEEFDVRILDQIHVTNRNPRMVVTFGEFVATKYQQKLALRKRSGRSHYRNILKNHVLPALGKLQLREITSDTVQELIVQKMDGLSPQTVLHIKNAISAVFRYARRIKWFHGELPTEGVELPEMVRVKERVAISKEQFLRLVAALPSPSREMVIVVTLTGMRKGELVGLKIGRLNLWNEPIVIEGRTIPGRSAWLKEAFTRVAREQVVGPDGKKRPRDPDEPFGAYGSLKGKAQAANNQGRVVPLMDEVVEALQAQLVHNVSHKLPTGPDAAVFASRTGKPINENNEMRRKIKPALVKLGLPSISWHDLRHTANTWAEGAGMTLTERKKLFGWSQDRMAEIYGHADVEGMRTGLKKATEGMRISRAAA